MNYTNERRMHAQASFQPNAYLSSSSTLMTVLIPTLIVLLLLVAAAFLGWWMIRRGKSFESSALTNVFLSEIFVILKYLMCVSGKTKPEGSDMTVVRSINVFLIIMIG